LENNSGKKDKRKNRPGRIFESKNNNNDDLDKYMKI